MISEDELSEIRRSLEPKPVSIGVDAQVVQLIEKLRVATETLDAVKIQLDKLDVLVDGLLKRSREINQADTLLYYKLMDLSPKVAADIKR